MRRSTQAGVLLRRLARRLRAELARLSPRRRDDPGRPGPSVLFDDPGDGTFGSGSPVEVVWYFPDPPENLYQLEQWLPVIENLSEDRRVAILCRHPDSYARIRERTSLPLLLVRYLRDLDVIYHAMDVKAAFYVNNHHLNFQSLTFGELLHVHVNHGESEKISMASNQAKAYDVVAVAGDAAIERYRANLLRAERIRFERVGRPQLDLAEPAERRPGEALRVVYAPTWEGGREAMDYSSVAEMGEAIVDSLLDADVALTYRPHPKTGTRRQDVARAHERILARLAETRREGPLPQLSLDEPLHEVLAAADVLIADVSSVTLDFLPSGRPFFVTTPPGFRGVATSTRAQVDAVGYPLALSDLPRLPTALEELRDNDPLEQQRRVLVERYFGDVSPGASLRRFEALVAAIVDERDELLDAKRQSNLVP